jgi:hypothetical protein
MNTLTIDLSPETYKRLEERTESGPSTGSAGERTPRNSAADRRTPSPANGPLSPTLRNKIIPGVTLDEVRTILSQATGPSLGEIINEQRGSYE